MGSPKNAVSTAAESQSETQTQTVHIHRGMVFLIIALSLLMMSIDSTIVATVLHSLQHGLDTSINWAGWTITAYSFGFVLMLPISSKLSERYGRRRVFLGSVMAFTLASLLCGLADNIFVLIALRAIQAAGGADFTPSATGIVVDYFGDTRDRAVSLFGSIFPVGAMLGPVFGGLLVSYWSWRSVFFVNVPLGLLIIALAWHFIPHDAPKKGKQGAHMDFMGVTLMGTSLLAGMLAASFLGEPQTSVWSAVFLLPMLLAVLSGWAFFRHITRQAQPFIAPRLIFGPGFGVVNAINMIYGGIAIGAVTLIPLYATNRYAIDALGSGTLLMAQGGAAILFSVVAALVIRRTGYRRPIFLGGLLRAAGMLLLAIEPVGGISPYVWLAFAAFITGAGGGVGNPASRNAGLQLAVEHSSTLAALRSLSLQIGAITVVTLATAVLANASHLGQVQAWFYVVVAVVLVLCLPLVSRVPEHKGAW